jgi:hypothetical protein
VLQLTMPYSFTGSETILVRGPSPESALSRNIVRVPNR